MENFKYAPKSTGDMDEIHEIIEKYSAVSSIPVASLKADFPLYVFVWLKLNINTSFK